MSQSCGLVIAYYVKLFGRQQTWMTVYKSTNSYTKREQAFLQCCMAHAHEPYPQNNSNYLNINSIITNRVYSGPYVSNFKNPLPPTRMINLYLVA